MALLFVLGPGACDFSSMEEDMLKQRLAARRAQIEHEFPEFGAAYDRLVETLGARNVGATALATGDMLPDFALPDAEGRLRTSADLLAQGPLVLAFYRGGWCSFCRTQFATLAECAGAIGAAGGRIVAISGETGGRGLSLKREYAANIDVLVDVDLGLALRFGLVFRLPDDLVAMMRADGDLIEEIYGNASGFLPIPATYVVGGDGRIVARHVDVDFRTRMEPAAILAALAALKARA